MEDNETLTPEQRRAETLMLGLRTVTGVEASAVDGLDLLVVQSLIADGMLDAHRWAEGRLAVTSSGRLFADATIRRLLD